jgi:signal peptidase I
MKLFEILLVVLTLASGLILLADKLYLAKRRAQRAGLLDSEPVLVDYSRAFFPVLAIVLIVRSFIAEPYKIPSSSMMPNLLIGDFILVNKFSYGLRLPISNTKIVPFGELARRRGGVPLPRPQRQRSGQGRELHQARHRRAG